MSDKEPIFLRRERAGLVPAYPRDAELLDAIPEGAVVSVQPKRPRSPRRHRWFWALCSKVAESHPYYATAEQVAEHLKYRTGRVSTVVLSDGKVIYVPKSISFSKMDETEFKSFVEEALSWVAKDLLPGINVEELRSEIERMMQ